MGNKRERERESREKDEECSGDEAAVSCDVIVACSFIVEPFPRETVSTTSNCWICVKVLNALHLSHRIILVVLVIKH